VQKLVDLTENGENMILRVKYYVDSTLPKDIYIFERVEHTVTLRDDGVYPDSVSGDFIYSTYILEDIDEFVAEITVRDDKILSDSGVYHFDGHDGKFVPSTDVPLFNYKGFNNYELVQVYQPLLDVTNCDNTIVKQNSLFITHLDVVEDPARTYKIMDNTLGTPGPSGNDEGAWTFGQLMKNMANTPVTGISTREFLKEWVKNWIVNQQVGSFAAGNNNSTTSYDNVAARHDLNNVSVQGLFIETWIKRAREVSGTYTTAITSSNWETEWDGTVEEDLIHMAPFKLMAIVNRLDIRGNSAYNGKINNAGETRFIYTLIDPVTGFPPKHFCIGSTSGGLDWVGMNVILEFGNPFDNVCDARLFAQQWYDLSAYTLGSDAYNEHLQAITDQVTDANAGGSKNFNKSAINQIRTNEKIFAGVNCFYGTGLGEWELADWELRQFELNSDQDVFLHQAVLTNTPVDDRQNTGATAFSYNDAVNLQDISSNSVYSTENYTNHNDILSWIYGPYGTSINRIRTRMGNHNLPEPFLAGRARIYKELAHYFGFDWTTSPFTQPSGFSTSNNTPDILAKEIRHQVSLNSCQGCHAGDTKTNFTQMMPRGYGEPANYWDPTPSYVLSTENHSGLTDETIDNRFGFNDPVSANPKTISNAGTTYDAFTSNDEPNLEYADKIENKSCQIVSPFITGRFYSTQTTNSWQDDEFNDNPLQYPHEGYLGLADDHTNKSDEFMHGLYYVNDPSNESLINTITGGLGGNFPQLHKKRWGFNDLQRRQDDLCRFLKTNCNGSIHQLAVFDILQSIGLIAFPLGGH